MKKHSITLPLIASPSLFCKTLLLSLFLAACGDVSIDLENDDTGKDTDNTPPTISSVANQTVIENQTFTLPIQASDQDGTISLYALKTINSANFSISRTSTTNTLQFTAPSVDTTDTLTIQITVTDNQGDTATETFTLTILPEATDESITTYQYSNLPAGVKSDLFSVTVEGTELDLLKTTPPPTSMSPKLKPGAGDGAESYRSSNRSFSWAQFGFNDSSPVNLVAQKLDIKGAVSDILVRPTQLAGIAYEIVSKDLLNRTISLNILQSNRKLSIEFVDDRYAPLKDLPKDALLIFADQLESEDIADIPDKNAASSYVVSANDTFDNALAAQASTVIFEAGTHDIGLWFVPTSVKHIYLEGGVYLLGSIDSDSESGTNTRKSDYTISGRGVISTEKFPWRADIRTNGTDVCVGSDGYSTGCPGDGVRPIKSQQNNFLIEGVTLVNMPFYAFGVGYDRSIPSNQRKGTISNVKMLGMWRYNNDGFDLPDNTELKDCFVAAMDDGFKMYHSNSSVKDCVVWQMDNGGIFQFGWFPKTTQGTNVENIHVIHTEWTGLNKNRGLANLTERPANDSKTSIDTSTRQGNVSNVSFKNIYMEGPVSRVIYLRNEEYANQSYTNWTFENIQVDYMPTYDQLVAIKQELGGNGQLNTSLLLNAIEDFNASDYSYDFNTVNGPTGNIRNIEFIDFKLNGKWITEDNKTTDGMFKLKLDSPSDVEFKRK